jgi:hypothetical protein
VVSPFGLNHRLGLWNPSGIRRGPLMISGMTRDAWGWGKMKGDRRWDSDGYLEGTGSNHRLGLWNPSGIPRGH